MNWREFYGGVRDTYLRTMLVPLFLLVVMPHDEALRWFCAAAWIHEQWRIINAD